MADKQKNPAAVQLGSLGGKKRVSKGFAKLSRKRRKEMAAKGAEARWKK